MALSIALRGILACPRRPDKRAKAQLNGDFPLVEGAFLPLRVEEIKGRYIAVFWSVDFGKKLEENEFLLARQKLSIGGFAAGARVNCRPASATLGACWGVRPWRWRSWEALSAAPGRKPVWQLPSPTPGGSR